MKIIRKYAFEFINYKLTVNLVINLSGNKKMSLLSKKNAKNRYLIFIHIIR